MWLELQEENVPHRALALVLREEESCVRKAAVTLVQELFTAGKFRYVLYIYYMCVPLRLGLETVRTPCVDKDYVNQTSVIRFKFHDYKFHADQTSILHDP